MKHLTFWLPTFIVFIFTSLNTDVFGVEFNFRHYQVENGLSSNTVNSIIQDSKGFIWIGTEDGLNRFDGYEFKIFRNNSREPGSIISNHIYSLYEDSDDLLWIGTEKGISLYDTNSEKISTFSQTTANGLSVNGTIQSMLEDKKGNIWICVYDQGVFKYNKLSKTLKYYSFEPYRNSVLRNSNLLCLYIDKDSDLWVSAINTKNHLYILNKKEDRFIPALSKTDQKMLSNISFYSMTEDSFGNLWAGSWDKGLFAIDKENETITPFLQDFSKEEILHIHTLKEIEPGKLLIGSDGGLTYYSIAPATNGHQQVVQINEGSLSNKFVYPIFKDREGGLWIGTYYGGINYVSPNRNTFIQYVHNPDKNSISGNIVSSMCEDNAGNLWIGTDDAGLNYYNTKTKQFTTIKTGKGGLSFHNIHGLCLDGDDLWIGTYSGGLNILNTRTKNIRYYNSNPSNPSTLYGSSIYSIFKDSRKNIWVGTMWGINLYNRKADNFVRVIRTNATIVDILQKNEVIYFATQGKGLYSFNQNTGKWKRYPFNAKNNSSIISNDISCLYLDESSQLWIGTNSGICRFDEKASKFIPVPTIFPSNNISYITSHDGSLWITTTKGLIRFNPKTQQFRVFTKGDGLLSEQFTLKSGVKTKSGKLYLGTVSGLNVINPDNIVNNPYIPEVAITDFQLLNQSVPLNEYRKINKKGVYTIKLPFSKNGFSLVFSALSYFSPEKNEYAYMLEGFDDNWNYVDKQRKATYTNLPPGTYTFKVKASNNDGVWNETGQTLNIVLTPPIWRSNVFMIFYLILFLLALNYTIKYFKKNQEKKQNERIEKIKVEHEKEVYNAKINFFTSIAHEIRTPVSLIMGPIEQINQNSTNFPEQTRDDLNIIERNAQRLLFLVNQLLDFRKIEKESIQVTLKPLNVTDLLQNICSRFESFFLHKSIHLEFKTDNKDLIVNIDDENLTKIVSNLLNNASKYSKDYVELALYSQNMDEQFEIRVTDNGIGIASEEQEKIFEPFYQVPDVNKPGSGIGLYLVKTVVDACGGSVKLESSLNQGSVFSIFLPLNKSEEKTSSNENGASETIAQNGNLQPINNTKNIPDNEKPVILILEDNVDMQEFLWKNFSGTYSVLLAGDGLEGIRILEKNEVDLIISDIMMPNMDGIEFCGKIKASFLWNHLPLILLTAKTNLSTKIEAMETGADAYVEKPFSMNYLAAQVKNLLDSRKSLQAKFAETPFMSLKSMAGNKADEEFLLKVNDVIEKNISNIDFSVEQLSEALCVSNSGLYAKIRTLSGVTPNKLLLLVRLKKAAELLCSNEFRINEICYMVGFNNPSYFAKCFHKQFGILPKDFRGSAEIFK
jgi:ligand-binding sensor domain-containing protein/signal transduction histidine kinase/DNA-binding response OmpR family regulator